MQRRGEDRGWNFDIVGEGPDAKKLMRLAKRYGLRNVKFWGKHPPVPFYKRSSIFLMTSKSEGWGLTLTEAQQYGVVPIAFNSYPALHDIITDGVDGIIIPEGDLPGYVDKLLKLMQDKDWRNLMATNALDNCRRFAKGNVGRMWWELLNDL